MRTCAAPTVSGRGRTCRRSWRALWRNVTGGGRYLARRLRGAGLVVRWAGTDQCRTLRRGSVVATVSGPPGEILLFLFGRQGAADVDVTGPEAAVAALHRAHLGM